MRKTRLAQYCASVELLAVLCATAARTRVPASTQRANGENTSAAPAMGSISGHMYMTALQSPQPGDRQKADVIVAAAKIAMAPYADYHKALADGYHIFLPNVPQRIYHFTNSRNALEAVRRFDPMKPTSLLYKKTRDGNYKLEGAMYTDRLRATEDELNERIPLSVARWHQHVNFCLAPPGERAEYFVPHPKFGMLGSITTKKACEATGGRFIPHVFGWMVHVYPYETDPSKIWSVDDGDGHDSMAHSAMPGMKMN
ncbi:MAG: hypothetical protein WA708_14555 [Acidobacteriaceae bacterium]